MGFIYMYIKYNMVLYCVYDRCTWQSPSECEMGPFLGVDQATPSYLTHETPDKFTAKMNTNMRI